MAPFDNGYSSTLINKLSPLIEGQVPDFVQADHAVFVRFLKHYYQYLESGELRLTVSIDNMLLEVQTESFLLLEDGDKIVVVRLGGHDGNSLRQARPCKICEPALRYAGIKHVYYSVWDNKFQYEYWGD